MRFCGQNLDASCATQNQSIPFISLSLVSPPSLHCAAALSTMSNTNTPQRTYIQKDGTVIPHSSRPLSARFSDLLASLVLFLTLFWQSLFNVPSCFSPISANSIDRRK